ncbi:hypothetical protein GCM10022225_07710 [Plantactinospora mayteni]|uniref:Tryptophan synthase beta chain-like PALP domain-containing protein n=1 Tax=Plantactinospora mayteni TaxID=566021 RepID=A0ABQ4EIC1_9ACTN|nr:pyridoxal-phosphate dependent enzyme [Plantactinospora mayteni]GIG94483.1 hypothetical protein Pma05_10560 [Plantactinospora mayteni]
MAAIDPVVELLPDALALVGARLSRTEVRDLDWLGPFANRSVTAKLENHQVTGSFKVRGALFAMSRLPRDRALVAPSAGNHGLAVAWAAAQLGMTADIVLPENASPLKRERILRLGSGVVEAGSTVEAAEAEARRIAEESDRTYLAPFDDPAVMAGQATAVVELLEQRPGLCSLLIPVGGGGLLAGAVAARAYLGLDALAIVACEPEAFASLAANVTAGRPVRLGRRPTFADGLATNIGAGSRTVEIAVEARNLTFCALSEEEIAAGCSALFNRESLLAEGAGAVGVAAALRAEELGLGEGPIGTLVCGGNVHHTTFWQMTAVDLSDQRLAALADTMGRTVDAEPSRRSYALPPVRTDWGSWETPDVEGNQLDLTRHLLDEVTKYTVTTASMLDDLEVLARDHALPLEEPTLGLVRAVNAQVRSESGQPCPDTMATGEQRVRALSQLAVAARLAFEWRSPGYDQSAALSALDLGALGSPGVNYARYEQPGVARIERQILGLCGLDPSTHTVLLTSSGMAAFALLCGTLFGHSGVRSVLTAPYLYFEGEEMLSSWLGRRAVVAGSYDAAAIAEQALATGSDAVFADPLGNHAEQRMVDVELLAELLSRRDDPPWLVVDGTMLPAATARALTAMLPDHAAYYESCSKYLQLGLDMAMAGMVVVPRALEARARRARRNLGLGLDRYAAELFPRFSPEQFERRLRGAEQSALRVARGLQSGLPADRFTVRFPGLPEHPDHALARRVGRTGSNVTVMPLVERASRDQLEPVVDEVLRKARSIGLPLVKGVSFGFLTSRLSAASAMAEGTPPFLRLAVGPCTPDAADLLAKTVLSVLASVWRTEPELDVR